MRQASASIDNSLFSLFWKYHTLSFLLKTRKRRRTEVLKLKNWHYLNYKGHFYLCVQRKTNAFLDVYARFGSFRSFRKVVRANFHLRLLPTQQCLTFLCVPCVKIKDPTTFYPSKKDRNSRDGNHSFEFCPLNGAHAYKSSSELCVEVTGVADFFNLASRELRTLFNG